jgi:hypothetical protein
MGSIGKVIGAVSGYWGEASTNAKPTDQWLIQAGWSKNVFGYGNTSVEYKCADAVGAATCSGNVAVGSPSGRRAIRRLAPRGLQVHLDLFNCRRLNE